MSAVEVNVTPWPWYSEDGTSVAWEVSVAEPKRLHTGLVWATRFDRFAKNWGAMNLRRSAPLAHRLAVQFMREFCSKIGQSGRDTSAAESVTNGENGVTDKRDTSRAHAGTLRVMSRCHGVTQSVTVTHGERDSDMASPGPEGPRPHHHHAQTEACKKSAGPKHLNDWLSLQAANLIARHDGGEVVAPDKLKLAREVLARAIPREPR